MALLLALGGVLAQRAAADTARPALIIAFAGYDSFVANLKTLDQLSHTKLAATVEAGIDQQMNGKGLAGVDKSRPWGLLVTMGDSGQPVVNGYLPVTNIKKALAAIPSTGGEAPVRQRQGHLRGARQRQDDVCEGEGQMGRFLDNDEALDSAPAELPAEISALAKKYLLAAKGCVQNVPAAQRGERPEEPPQRRWNSCCSPRNNRAPRSSGRCRRQTSRCSWLAWRSSAKSSIRS